MPTWDPERDSSQQKSYFSFIISSCIFENFTAQKSLSLDQFLSFKNYLQSDHYKNVTTGSVDSEIVLIRGFN